MTTTTKTQWIKRYAIMLLGLFLTGFAIACTKRAALGVSPVSSVANVLNLRFPFLSIGNWLIITNCLLLLGQVLLLRRKFRLIQLLQIPVSFLLGWFTDLSVWLLSPIPTDAYPVRLGLVLVGVLILGFGITLTVKADVVMNAGEAFVKALADTIHRPFGTVKVIFDVSFVTASVILSLCLFGGELHGTREGTVITAVCTGFAVKLFTHLCGERIERMFEDR